MSIGILFGIFYILIWYFFIIIKDE